MILVSTYLVSPRQRKRGVMHKLRQIVFEHGGSQIWSEDDNGNIELVADIYGQPHTDIIWNNLKKDREAESSEGAEK